LIIAKRRNMVFGKPYYKAVGEVFGEGPRGTRRVKKSEGEEKRQPARVARWRGGYTFAEGRDYPRTYALEIAVEGRRGDWGISEKLTSF